MGAPHIPWRALEWLVELVPLPVLVLAWARPVLVALGALLVMLPTTVARRVAWVVWVLCPPIQVRPLRHVTHLLDHRHRHRHRRHPLVGGRLALPVLVPRVSCHPGVFSSLVLLHVRRIHPML